ncbi:hypothetical protein CPC08DRAFT_771647 [Agrocybe pediades]|nr:hypothetical protein CPC08DRAFT_771647 [Agrocybe pediades]
MSSINLTALLAILRKNPVVEDQLSLEGCITFLELVQLMKPVLALHQSDGFVRHLPLERLPSGVLGFLEKCLSLEHEDAKLIWDALSPLAWTLEADFDRQVFGRRYLSLFLKHGAPHGIGPAFGSLGLPK